MTEGSDCLVSIAIRRVLLQCASPYGDRTVCRISLLPSFHSEANEPCNFACQRVLTVKLDVGLESST